MGVKVASIHFLTNEAEKVSASIEKTVCTHRNIKAESSLKGHCH